MVQQSHSDSALLQIRVSLRFFAAISALYVMMAEMLFESKRVTAVYPPPISPANSKPFFAAMTAMISLMTAAAAIVP